MSILCDPYFSSLLSLKINKIECLCKILKVRSWPTRVELSCLGFWTLTNIGLGRKGWLGTEHPSLFVCSVSSEVEIEQCIVDTNAGKQLS